MAAGFSVKDALNKNSKAGIDESPRARFRTKDISIFKMYRNDMNFYSVEQIEELAGDILMYGLKQNLELVYAPCIMPPFVMRDILKVIRASETAEVVIPLWEVIPGEYEEYAHQVLNSNAGKKGFVYRYISHRPFRSEDIYWIMEHQLQELEVDGRPCFEKVSLMTDEATIHVTCSEYFFRCCKELETIFYHYSENHVEEL